jgi:hypothetical protein
MDSDLSAAALSYLGSAIAGPAALAALVAESQSGGSTLFSFNRSIYADSILNRERMLERVLLTRGAGGVNRTLRRVTHPASARREALAKSARWWGLVALITGVEGSINAIKNPPALPLDLADPNFGRWAWSVAGAAGAMAMAWACAQRGAGERGAADELEGCSLADRAVLQAVEAVRVSGGKGVVVPPALPLVVRPAGPGRPALRLPRLAFLARSPHDKSAWMSVRVPFL